MLIDSCTITISSNAPTYIFTLELSDLTIDRLKYKRLLGFRFPKNEYEFLNDLRNMFADELMTKFKEMMDNEKTNQQGE